MVYTILFIIKLKAHREYEGATWFVKSKTAFTTNPNVLLIRYDVTMCCKILFTGWHISTYPDFCKQEQDQATYETTLYS